MVLETDKDGLLEARKQFEKVGLPCILYGSTLLGIYRDGELLGKPDLCYRNVDYDREKMDDFIVNWNGNISSANFKERAYSIHDIGACHLEIHAIYYYKKWAYSNITEKDILFWDRKMYEKLDTIKWAGKKWYIPSDTDRWLEMVYGESWRTPQTWNWRSAPNRIISTEDKLTSKTFEEALSIVNIV